MSVRGVVTLLLVVVVGGLPAATASAATASAGRRAVLDRIGGGAQPAAVARATAEAPPCGSSTVAGTAADDPPGDGESGRPAEIARVTADLDASCVLRVTVSVLNRPGNDLGATDVIAFFLDTDANAATGAAHLEGADAAVLIAGSDGPDGQPFLTPWSAVKGQFDVDDAVDVAAQGLGFALPVDALRAMPGTAVGIRAVSLVVEGEASYRDVAPDAGTVPLRLPVAYATRAARATSTPGIAGRAVVGSTLRCEPPSWDVAPRALSFQWLRGRTSQVVGLLPAYDPTFADAGTTLRCSVTAVTGAEDELVLSQPAFSAAVRVRGVAPVRLARPRIRGVPRVGATLTCHAGRWRGRETTRYAWLRNGTAVPGARRRAYRPATRDAGHALACRVTAVNRWGRTVVTTRTVRVR